MSDIKLEVKPFGVTTEDLTKIVNFDQRNSPELFASLKESGGVDAVAEKLHTDLKNGLRTSEQKTVAEADDVLDIADKDLVDGEERRAAFGENKIPPAPSKTVFELIWANIKADAIIQVLFVGAFVTLVIGTAIHPKDGWLEGLAILVAVLIVLSVTAINDYSKERKFKKLLMLQSEKRVKVIRNGQQDEISSWHLCVGDLVEIVPGDEIPADGLYVRGNRMVVDESPLTGESVPVKKSEERPFMFSGCQASEGDCVMLVTAVGVHSSGGQIQAILNEAQSEETPLQRKLRTLAIQVGKFGIAAGIFTFLGLAIRFAIDYSIKVQNGGPTLSGEDIALKIVMYFVTGVTIVVVAVPEGLPLAVTIALAFSMFKMIKDKCFVRHLAASETMGEATCICTDKTGTLTENRMTIVRYYAADENDFKGQGCGELGEKPFAPDTFKNTEYRDLLTEGLCSNSTCFIKKNEKDGSPIYVGSATEGAMLVFSQKVGTEYESVREKATKIPNGDLPFTSERKRMATMITPIVKPKNFAQKKYRVHVKGASEIVLALCKQVINPDTLEVSQLTEQEINIVQQKILAWASEGLRTLVVAFKDTDNEPKIDEKTGKPENIDVDLIFIGLVGIKDPIRKEVPQAVRDCQKAGLVVRMVTGDNIVTAKKIASECSILTSEGICMEGPEFRALSDTERRKIVGKLQVLARSSPKDKFILVSLLKDLGEVVAVTGDGTNDAPALKEADVGFAMGISGTQIAMNACDIVLLDDNFASIVNSIRWGRNVFQVIRRFLQFQLAVNVAAILITFFGSVASSHDEPPLSTVQLLWINLIMDSFGALALASEDPDEKILDHPPHKRDEKIINVNMLEYMGMIILYQTFIGLFTLFQGYVIVGIAATDIRGIHTLVFTSFVLLQVTNEITARQLEHELNFFHGLFGNWLFIAMILLILVIQTLMVQFAGAFIQTVPLNAIQWCYAIVVALFQIVYVVGVRLLFRLYNRFGACGRGGSRHGVTPDTIELEEGRRASRNLVAQ